MEGGVFSLCKGQYLDVSHLFDPKPLRRGDTPSVSGDYANIGHRIEIFLFASERENTTLKGSWLWDQPLVLTQLGGMVEAEENLLAVKRKHPWLVACLGAGRETPQAIIWGFFHWHFRPLRAGLFWANVPFHFKLKGASPEQGQNIPCLPPNTPNVVEDNTYFVIGAVIIQRLP